MTRSTTLALTLVLAVPATATAVPAVAAAPTCQGLRATIVGTARANTITGTDRRDVIVAGAGNDRVNGGGGDDVICAGDGADVVLGGAGDDRLYGDLDAYFTDAYNRLVRQGDTILPGSGNDVVDPGYDRRPTTAGAATRIDTISYASAPAAAVVDLRTSPATVGADGVDTIVVAASLNFVGTDFNDVIHGTPDGERIVARGGDDQVFGHGGDDVISADHVGALGNDLVNGGDGEDTLTSSVGLDTLQGGPGRDAITSTATSRVSITGGSGSDTVAVQVPGETGFKVVGASGQDKLRLSAYPNPALVPRLRIDQRKGLTTVSRLQPTVLSGKVQSFAEVVLPGGTSSIYKGTRRSEVIDANPDAAAVIKGRGGADVITGSELRDTLVGGRGFDIGRGRGGRDRCSRIERRSSC